MPLLDHFHPPLFGRRHWEGLHGRWAAAVSDGLNEHLPAEYFSEFQVKFGTSVEVDVATFTERDAPVESGGNGRAVAVQTQVWSPPVPVAVMPAVFPDDIEVQVYDGSAGPVLVAAIELVSPANKDRPETRRAFVAKCAAYLQRGIGLMIVDIVTSSRHANLHDELVTLLGHADGYAFETETLLYSTAFRPAHRQERNEIDLWRSTFDLGAGPALAGVAPRGARPGLPADRSGSKLCRSVQAGQDWISLIADRHTVP